MMKRLLLLSTAGLLSLCLAACGGSSSSSSTVDTLRAKEITTRIPSDTTPAPLETKADADKDNDIGAPDDDRNNNDVLDFGHAASPSETRAITALVKRYYAAAAAEDGAKACSMIYSTLAEAVPEDYGLSPPGPHYMSGKTCPAVLTLLFKHFRPQILVELPKLKVARVRLIEHHGLVVLHFGAMPERQIQVRREGHTWKVEGLLDNAVS
jgi:hypothetical protein